MKKNNNPSTAKEASQGNLFQRFSTSLRVQYSAITILMAVVPLVIVAVTLGIFVSRQVRTAMTEEAFAHLTSVRESEASEIADYFAARENDITVLADSTYALYHDALDHVTAARETKQSRIEDYFQTTFGVVHALKDNPTTVRAIWELEEAFMAEDRRTGGPQWTAAYEEFNPVFQNANTDFGFADILLIAASGDVVYTVSGPAVLGENVLRGDLKDSGLGRVFQSAMASEQELAFADFAPYAPLGNEVAAFVAYAVENITGTVGVVAIQLPATKLNAIVQQHTGLPETGETFLVAQEPDGRITFRNDRLTVGGGKFVIGYDLSDIAPQSVRNALSGETDTEILIGGTGLQMLASYAPVNVGVVGLNWAIVSRMPLKNALIPQIPGEEQDYFQRYAETRGYPDLYLFSSDGFLFYSVKHEPDYHTNLLTGPYQDSNLGQMLAEIVESQKPSMTDFARYAPIQDAPAAFVAAPVMHGDKLELIVAARLPLDQISAVVQAGAGLGETGETYLVGLDKMWRSNSRFLDQLGVESTVLNTETPVRTEASLSALARESGTRSIENYRGVRVLSSWEPLVLDEPDSDDPKGVVWAVIAEIDESEALSNVASIATFIITLSLVLLGVTAVVAAGVGSLIAGRLVKPIAGLTESAVAIAGGDLAVTVAHSTSSNEIGVLTNAFGVMTTRLRETVGALRETAENLTERTRELEASRRVTFAASERTTPDELLGLVVDLVRDQFDLYHVQIYLVDKERDAAVLRQSTGYAGRQLLQKKHQIPLEATSLVTKAIHTGEPVLVDDTSTAPNFMPNPLLPETRSELVVPLRVGDEALGVLDAQARSPGRFTSHTVELFQAMVDQVSFLLENSELLERITEQQESLTVFTTQLRTVAEIARRIGTILDTEELLQQVVELLRSRFGLYHAHIYLLNKETRQLVVQAGSGEVGRVLRERGHQIPLEREKSLVARAARGQAPALVTDTTLDSDFMPNPLLPQTRSELAVPLIAGGEVLGVLDLQDDQLGRFAEKDVDTYLILAGQLATALQNAQAFEAQQRAEKQILIFQTMAETSNDAIVMVDPGDNQVLYANPAARELYGDIEMTTHLGTEFWREEDLPYLAETVLPQTLATGWQGDVFQKRLDDGTVFEANATVFMIRDATETPTHMVVMVRDITERKEAEAERERFTLRLSTAADIAGQVSALLDPEQIFDAAITLLKERFGLYYVHVYILDEDGEKLRLRAGYGEPGRIMLERGHSIPLESERSLVARAARTHKIVLVHDVTEDPGFLPNPLLPDTRSEVAVPGLVGDTLVGVFDVQHDEAHYFTQADLDVFSTLTGQLATAFQNAQAFEAQQRAEEQILIFQTMAETSNDAIVMVDPGDNQVLYANPAARELYGAAEMTAHLGTEFWREEDLPYLAETVWPQTLATGWQGDIFQKRLDDGTVFEANATVFMIRDATETPTHMVVMVRDITERKAREEDLLRLNSAVEQVGDGIALIDLEGNILFVNSAWAKMHGYDNPTTLMGKPLSIFHTAEQLEEEVVAFNEQAMAQGSHQGEVGHVTRDGQTFPTLMTTTIIKNEAGQLVGLIGTVRDITERKEAEAERERFTRQLRTAADIAGQVSEILDPDKLLNTVIPLLKERFNLYYAHVYTLEEETLKLRAGYGEPGAKMLAVGHNIPLAHPASLVAQAARNREIVVVDDVTTNPRFMPNPLLPDTKSEVAVPLVAGEQVLGVFDVQHDQVNYFTQADLDVFSTLAGQLATALQNADFVEELRQTTERLREVDRLKSEFLANMSHELRTPLNSIIGYAEIMMMGIDGSLDDETLKDVQAIYENGQHLLNMINDILDLAKIEARQMTLNLAENVNVAQVLADLETSNASLFATSPVEFLIEIEDDLPLIRADRVRLHQILNNLVGNSEKFTETGYVKVRAYQQSRRWLCIAVEDTGIGISAADQVKIFDRFRQADGSSTRQVEGTGLGLSITKQLIQMHSGRIEVESALGAGSTFTVWLPLET